MPLPCWACWSRVQTAESATLKHLANRYPVTPISNSRGLLQAGCDARWKTRGALRCSLWAISEMFRLTPFAHNRIHYTLAR